MTEPELWYPAAIRDPAPSWGTHADHGEPKFLLHTTEGPHGLYAPDPSRGSGRRYFGNQGTWPHVTLARPREGWRVYQHIPANFSAMSLRNLPGGVETNRDNTIQVEVAWKAAEIRELPDAAMDQLARLLAWAHQVRGVPIRSTVKWVPYPQSYGERAAQRLSGPVWDAYAGVLGHAHAPENDHGDPGNIDIVTLLQAAAWYADPEDEMTPDQEARMLSAIGAVSGQVWGTAPAADVKQADMRGVVCETYRKAGDIQKPGLTGLADRLGRVEAAVRGEPPGLLATDVIMAGLDEVRDPAELVDIARRATALAYARMTVPTEETP